MRMNLSFLLLKTLTQWMNPSPNLNLTIKSLKTKMTAPRNNNRNGKTKTYLKELRTNKWTNLKELRTNKLINPKNNKNNNCKNKIKRINKNRSRNKRQTSLRKKWKQMIIQLKRKSIILTLKKRPKSLLLMKTRKKSPRSLGIWAQRLTPNKIWSSKMCISWIILRTMPKTS